MISAIDPADFNVLTGCFRSIAAEMSDIMLRAAYSTIVREAKDCSTCLMDAEARTVAQAEAIAVHMNSLSAAVPYFRERYDIAKTRPDEMYITNNPYQNGQHLNDIILLMPVFHDDRLVAFTGSICHHLELGGAVAGSNANATEVYHEGLILPAMKINEADLYDGPVEAIIRANCRLPEIVLGDFHAQLSAVMRGRKLMQELVQRHGVELTSLAMRELQDYSERMLRATIRALPDGTYSGEDALDGRTLDSPQPMIRAKVTIRGDEAFVDLSDSDDQVSWPVTCPVASTHSAVMTVFGQIAGSGVPTNDGTYRPIRIATRKGSILDPHHPAPVRGRMASAYRTASAVKRALGSVIADRLSAAGSDSTNIITMSRPRGQGYEMFAESISGGYGAGPANDGADVIAQMLSNTANTPVEALEMDHDFMRLERYEMIQDSGGAGTFRGGLGVRRVYDILDDGVLLSTNGDRHMTGPWALAGGHEGSRAMFGVIRDGQLKKLPAATNLALQKGDKVIIEISGGGGYGEPAQRDRAAVRRDLREGRISAEAARAIYRLAER
ncbi:MAG: hydantoinase B/oxoprolinase family protein [Hyphomicrobiaceae bacterium]